MPVPTTIAELSTTAGNNSPVGGDAPSALDNHQRQAYAFIKELSDKQQSGAYTWLGTGGGTADVITASAAPDITAYAAGQTFRFIASGANTTNVTINIDGLGAKAITKAGAVALAAGDIVSGAVLEIVYDGTRFVLSNSNVLANIATAAAARTALTAAASGANSDITALTGITGLVKLNKGADVASAAALPLIADGNYFDVTGTVTVSSMATLGVGTQIKLHFDDALILTHNATDLILPGAANITTAAGDEAEFIEYATGDWRCVNYSRASAQGVNYATESKNASGTSFDFTIPAWAKEIKLCFYNISTTGSNGLRIQLGDSGGIEGSGYLGGSSVLTGSVSSAAFSSGFDIGLLAASAAVQGHLTLVNMGGNDWSLSGTLSRSDTGLNTFVSGTKPTSATLTTVRITTTTAVDTFDGGLVVAVCR
jgi:hypothetical protein